MYFKEFQSTVQKLAETVWPESSGDAVHLFALLLEETGELAQTVRKTAGPRLGHPGEVTATIEQVEDEIGDVLFLLARIALATGADLEAAACRVIDKIERRIQDEKPGC